MTHDSQGTGTCDRLNLTRFLADPSLTIADRVDRFADYLDGQMADGLIVGREIASPMDREVVVRDRASGGRRRMLMFGSNNYLGFANDPYVRAQTAASVARWGAGLGGPPLLNGTTTLHVELERRLSTLKRMPAALVYSSGYGANVGWLTALAQRKDAIVLDERCHASIFDGARAAKCRVVTFRHNDVADLRHVLGAARRTRPVNVIVVVEGVYSMDGDLAPLDRIVPVCKAHDAWVALDDAHGTGILGERGGGTAEHFGVERDVDLVMGTFSKALAATGAFVAARKEIVDYLRFFSRPYTFSASMPPPAVAMVHAGLDLIEREPQRRQRLHDNVRALVDALGSVGIRTASASAIVPVHVPGPIRPVSARLHEAGVFVNAIEYPAVPMGQDRFRVSVMSEHTADDIDRLVRAFVDAYRAEGLL